MPHVEAVRHARRRPGAVAVVELMTRAVVRLLIVVKSLHILRVVLVSCRVRVHLLVVHPRWDRLEH